LGYFFNCGIQAIKNKQTNKQKSIRGASSLKSPHLSCSSDTEDIIDSYQSDTECLEQSLAKKRWNLYEKHVKERLTVHEECSKTKAVDNTTRNGKWAWSKFH